MKWPGAPFLHGLAAPVGVLFAAAVLWILVHATAALIVLAAGWGVILVRHALNIDRLTRWAESSLDAHVPEGTGPW